MTSRIRRPRHRSLDGLARDRLDHSKEELAQAPSPLLPGLALTFINANNQLSVTGDTLAVGNPRVVVSGGTLPVGLVGGTIYYLRDDGTNLYTLHPTKADAAGNTNEVAFADDGTGTHQLTFID